MSTNPNQKSKIQRKLHFDDSEGQSDEKKQHAEVLPRKQKRSATPNTNPPNKNSYNSPQKKIKTNLTTINVVTPNESEVTRKVAARHANECDYIPSYIHKNLDYTRKDHITKISPQQSKVLQWISDNYEIPNDFEQNRKYGPLSGSSYVDRVIAAYRLGTLHRIKELGGIEIHGNNNPTVICTVCANVGHLADTCPSLL